MHIDRVVTGLLEENCYILEKDNKLLVVDPGDDIDKINKVINNREVLKVLKVILKTLYHIILKKKKFFLVGIFSLRVLLEDVI